MTDEYVFDWCFDLVFYTPFETDLIRKIRTTHLFDHVLIYVLLVTDFTKLQKWLFSNNHFFWFSRIA